jgi:putative SOS response-associated peptidase YedK
MCGRFSQFSDVEALAGAFTATVALARRPPMYNLAPGMHAAVVVPGALDRQLVDMRWGLLPPWAKDPALGYRLINARVETVAQKPSFRRAYQARRCLVPADGFFEWSGDKGHRQPWFIHAAAGGLLAFAGLWESWQPPEGGVPWRTFTIITTKAEGHMADIHHRMPVTLDLASRERWLGRAPLTDGQLAELVARCRATGLERFPVSAVVNAARNNTPACVARAPETAP